MTDWSAEAVFWYWLITIILFLFNVFYTIIIIRWIRAKRKLKNTARARSRPPTPRIKGMSINDHIWIDDELWTFTNYTHGAPGEDNRPPRMVLKLIEPVENWDQYR